MKRRLALGIVLALAFALLQPVLGAGQNILELKIDSINTSVRAGEKFEFSYFAGNRAGEPCPASIEYGFEADGAMETQGTEIIYLGTGETKQENGSLTVPPEIDGTSRFFLRMACNDSTVAATRVVNVSTGLPSVPRISSLELEQYEEGKQLAFAYSLYSVGKEPVPVYLQEMLTKDGKAVWENTEKAAVTGTGKFERLGPVLAEGNYTLHIKASMEEEDSELTRVFSVEAKPAAGSQWEGIPLAVGLVGGLAAVGLGGGTALVMLARKKKQDAAGAARAKAEKAAEKRECVAESESAGIVDESALEELAEKTGLTAAEKKKAMETYAQIPVLQSVKSCVVSAKNAIKCETTVKISVENNTNRNWKNIVMLAELPSFLAESQPEIEYGCECEETESPNAVKLCIPEVKAMQSESIEYVAPKVVSQAEANSVALPAVISYKKSKPLVIAQVRAEGKQTTIEEGKKQKVKARAKKGKRKTKKEK